MSFRRMIDRLIADVSQIVESKAPDLPEVYPPAPAAPHCPACRRPALQVFSLMHPVGYTGIYLCPFGDCQTEMFDPTFREV